ncbi:MAG: hypothetical protein MI923_11405 [Phycisphaerales bacterium]|nr:hypothetical protein [Phycisphaerales bacterium]
MNTKKFDPPKTCTDASAQANFASLGREGQPDWDIVEFDVFCSRCAYNLRALSKPRCPECGLQFDWHVVLDEAARHSDFLFEHNWETRPILSWWTTFRRSFRPIRFWNNVSIHDRVCPGPLWFMLGVSIVLFFVVLHGTALCSWIILDHIYDNLYPVPWRFGPGPPPTLELVIAELEDIAQAPVLLGSKYLLALTSIMSFLLAMLAVPCSLWQTLGKCRVRTVQILRTVAYMLPPAFVLCSWVILCFIILMGLVRFDNPMHDFVFAFSFIFAVTLIPAFYVGTGLKRYLQLPRAYFVAVVTSIIALLFLMSTNVIMAAVLRSLW